MSGENELATARAAKTAAPEIIFSTVFFDGTRKRKDDEWRT